MKKNEIVKAITEYFQKLHDKGECCNVYPDNQCVSLDMEFDANDLAEHIADSLGPMIAVPMIKAAED